MYLLFELSGEHPELPAGEIMALLRISGASFKVVEQNRLLVIDSDINEENLKNIASRLSLSFCIDELLCSSTDIRNILNEAETITLPKGTFRVRSKRLDGGHGKLDVMEIEEKVGSVIAKNHKVDLEKPLTEIRVLTRNKYYLTRKLHEIDRNSFQKRRAVCRPFFLPISLHPRIARAMVNLSQVKSGDKLMDPFCGTGGILLEAGLLGIAVTGSDIDSRMVEGCKKTLTHYGITEFHVFQADVKDIGQGEKVDAVVSDFPYGRSTRINRVLHDVYERGFDSIKKVLHGGKRAVLGLPSTDAIKIGERYLDLIELYPYRVHKSLTRYFSVFKA